MTEWSTWLPQTIKATVVGLIVFALFYALVVFFIAFPRVAGVVLVVLFAWSIGTMLVGVLKL